MVNKQPYLTDSQIEGIREIVQDLTKKGLKGTLKGAAIGNISEMISNDRHSKESYMSTEQAWATAVVSYLLSHGYDIVKRPNET